MKFTPTPLVGSFIIDLEPSLDDRGWFARTYCKNEFEQIGHYKEWVQLNHSFSSRRGTLRGMHFQYPPHAEVKMVRCITGAIYDVIIDIREGSLTFLQWYCVELSEKNKKMIYIPEGFAHGFQTLTDNTSLIYHHTASYIPNADAGIRFDDPSIDIQWALPPVNISEKDKSYSLIDNNFKGIEI